MAIAFATMATAARAAEPIRIGFGMAETGPLAANGKSASIGMQIWKDDTNAEGGLLGRPLELVFYDDQSNPSRVPGIYTKLLDVDKVDLVASGYVTNVIAPALPVIIQHNATFLSLFGLEVNSEFHYPKYFTMTPTAPDAAASATKFGPDGELSESRALMVQYQHLAGDDIDQFKGGKNPIILWPDKYRDGNVIYPCDAARN